MGGLHFLSQVGGEDPPHQEGVGGLRHVLPQGHDARAGLIQRVAYQRQPALAVLCRCWLLARHPDRQ